MRDGGESRQPEYRRLLAKQRAKQVREQRDDHSQNDGCEKTLQLLTIHPCARGSTERSIRDKSLLCDASTGLRIGYRRRATDRWFLSPREQLSQDILQDSAVLVIQDLLWCIDAHLYVEFN